MPLSLNACILHNNWYEIGPFCTFNFNSQTCYTILHLFNLYGFGSWIKRFDKIYFIIIFHPILNMFNLQ